MKRRNVALLVLTALLTVASAPAHAQMGVPDPTTIRGSVVQVPTAEPAAGAPAMPMFQLGSLGWDEFLSNHGGRLILSMSRWSTRSNRAAISPASRLTIVGSRAAR
ncbi:MAG: hypothetical protein ACRENS_01995 [Candidatus Eiseniibacteriota bacterium]